MNSNRPNEDETKALWKKARTSGVSRREFLILFSSAGAAAVLSACAPKIANISTTVTVPSAEPTPSAPIPVTPTQPVPPTPTPAPEPPIPLAPTPTPTPEPPIPPAPARFVLGDLTITPASIMIGEQVTISIQVSNTGGTEGSYIVVFQHKQTQNASVWSDKVEVNLKPGETKTATLTTAAKESGTYHVSVNDKFGQYTVTPLVTKPFARQTKIEVVTKNAAAVNPKGGQQTRVVHTQDGIFTVYLVEGSSETSMIWQLSQRQSNGTWAVIAQDVSGGSNPNLLTSPDGTLHVIGWPNGIGTMWSGKPKDGKLVMTSTRIPNVDEGTQQRPTAGTDANGDLCINSGVPNGSDPLNKGAFTGAGLRWAFYIPSQSRWVTQTNKLDYMYAYAYVFPSPSGQLSLVATRDCGWAELGYAQPPGTNPWVFNAFRYWRTNDISSETIRVLSFAEEIPTDQYPDPWLKLHEAYLDTKDRMHIIYSRSGATTATTGKSMQTRHRIVSDAGTTLFDEELPKEAGQYCRIFQDSQERFYLLGSSGLLYPMDQEGQGLGDPMKLNLEGRENMDYGYSLSVLRTGTPLSDVMDVGFPSDGGKSWYYFQLDFSGKLPAEQHDVNFKYTAKK